MSQQPHWSSDQQDGPSHWKELKATCGGDKQSPVNIDRRRLQRDSGLGDILFEGYDQAPPGTWRLANDGHTGGCCGRAPSSAPAHRAPSWYRALQLHFHWGSPVRNGSEHTLDGHQLPMELHIVHINVKYRTLAEAKGHPNGLAVLVPMSLPAGDAVDLASTFRLSTLLPRTGRLSGYYRYQGSLTTPDCSEVVVWTVFEEPVEIGREQVLACTAPLSSTQNPWVAPLLDLPDLFCIPGSLQVVGATRRGCWRGWNKAEVLAGGCRSLPLWVCVPSALLGQGAWPGGVGLVGRELGDDVWVALGGTCPAHGCAGGYETLPLLPVQ
uniref:Alpha-carbonic anhydrase domain-containing protein n=1 Tax=Bubo bubo TaxID=30461 RepID=A0A8C0E7A5_BUBBB